MTEVIDQLIQARFDAVGSPIGGGDWQDVVARARAARPRRARRRAARVAAAAVVLAVTAVGFGWPQSLVDFISSPPAPANVQSWFGAQNVSAPAGMDPRAIPAQARKIATATFDVNHVRLDHPTVHTLYVAPRKGGGFCYLWTDAAAGCVPARSAPRKTGPLGIEWFAKDYPLVVSGSVRSGATKTVEARFADGTTATIPVTWVSAPVNAGFFAYPVPAAHRTSADALTSVVALGANGHVLGRQTFRLTGPLDEDVPQTLPDGTKVSLPRRAHAAQARKIIGFRAKNGSQVYLWLMPRTGGGECYAASQSSGCMSPYQRAREPVLNGGLAGGASRILFFAEAKPEVATVELRYQNGESERLRPVDGFVLHEITPAHYGRGTRLAAAVALDRGGKMIYTERFRPQEPGLYPCRKPVDRGYGVKMCP